MLDKIYTKLKKVNIQDGCITDIALIEKTDNTTIMGLPIGAMPEYVKVNVTCTPEEGSNIRIEVWLPTEKWNGDFMGTGNGGAAGRLATISMFGPLRLGFAVANTDLGTSQGADCGIGNKAVWKDFGYRATHLMTVVAKELIEKYYGKPANHSYFTGGSTGGQQALMEAQRYPEDYDGILACAPAYDRTNLHMGFVWDWLAVNKGVGGLFSADDAQCIVNAILTKYGEDGERHSDDAFMYRPDKIQMAKEIFENLNFTQTQINALMKIYQGAVDPVTGERIYEPTMIPGSEACDLGLIHRCEHPGFEKAYFYIFRWLFGADFDFTKFDFHKHGEEIHRELDAYLNATDTDLTAFRDKGGKLLMIHGTADPIIPVTSSIRYYEQVSDKMGEIDDFFRFYLSPGMAHISGGPGVQDIVFGFPATPKDSKHLGILALKEWVETGVAPEKLYPIAFKTENPLHTFLEGTVLFEREIEPYKRK
ncbi:MAG: tannase/feruloyl esterase family alpha/beta hydrolase [Agathobacter sp.]|nr:tannase/feruloyl esterase family alpha/beta hydrolase [Agathobacter sp.]